MPEHLIGFLAALGGGLLIGIERERRKGSGAGRALAGVRSFTLASLAGAIAQALAQPWLVGAGAALILALAAIAYRRDRSEDPGVTTEIALFVTYLLGVASIGQPAAAAAGAVLVASLLAARSRMHRFAVEVLSARELRDALILAGAALVLLPLLPDEPLRWLGGLNARRVWMLAVILMALQGAGYVAQRWLGTRRGLALAGLASGFVSSTATIAALGSRVREDAAHLNAAVASALFSTLATFILFGVIAAAVHAPSLRLLAAPLAAGFAATALAAAGFYLRARGAREPRARSGRAFDLPQATLFALGLTALTALVGLASERYGNGAAQAGAALAGFLDAHAAGASVLALAAEGSIAADAALWACLLGLSTNTASKLAVAFASGGRRYGLRAGAGLVGALAAAWLAAVAPAMKRLIVPALAYFALVFGAGFVLGTVRILWLVPQFGVRTPELAEAPVMLLVVVCAARWIVQRFAIPPAPAPRLATGLIALACLLALEFTVVRWLQGIPLRESLAGRDPVSGAVYAGSLLLFALMPLIAGRGRARPG